MSTKNIILPEDLFLNKNTLASYILKSLKEILEKYKSETPDWKYQNNLAFGDDIEEISIYDKLVCNLWGKYKKNEDEYALWGFCSLKMKNRPVNRMIDCIIENDKILRELNKRKHHEND